jgi:3'-5' exoribonuclease
MSDLRSRLLIDGKSILPESLPPVFRVVEYKAVAIDLQMICCTATLYHRHVTLRVAWTCRTIDPAIRPSVLVSIQWRGTPTTEEGALHIRRLRAVAAPDERTNLFDTIPAVWRVDSHLVERGHKLINALPRRFKHLFNAVLGDGQRFLRYLTGPGSLDRTHTGLNGNLRHGLEVAERALTLAESWQRVCRPLIILGSLLHDAGKADRYQLHPTQERFAETERGRRVGHRAVLLDWLSEASASIPNVLPSAYERALTDLVIAVNSAPERTGMGEVPSLETRLVDQADRWSLQNDAVRNEQTKGGRGTQPDEPEAQSSGAQPCRS